MILRPAEAAKALGFKYTSAVYNLVKKGLLPPPIKVGKQASGWPEKEIQAFADACTAGVDDDTLREIVAGLQRQRAEKLSALKTQLGLGAV